MKWIDYLLDKLPELTQLGGKDWQLSKLVARIHRKRSEVRLTRLRLNSISPLHAIDRDTARARLAERVAALQEVRQQWLSQDCISEAQLSTVLPSVSAIKVIRVADNRYLAFEGNGRLYALQQVFTDLYLEVDLYVMDEDPTITRRVNRVLNLNGLPEC